MIKNCELKVFLKKNPFVSWGEKEKRLGALLALFLTRPEKAGPCLDDEMLAAFHEGRLSKTEEKTVREHVAKCGACYERWLEAYDWVPRSCGFFPLSRAREFMQDLFSPKSRAWLGAVGALAAACFILAFTFLLSRPSESVLKDWLGTELRSLVSIAPGGVVPKVPAGMAFSSQIRGFSLTDLPLAGKDLAAFTSGVRLAAAKLADAEPSWRGPERLLTQALLPQGGERSKEWQDGREFLEALGYWSALVAVACEMPASQDEGLLSGYLQKRQRQLQRLWLQARKSPLSEEAKRALASWVQEAARSRGRELCHLKPVVLARELLSGHLLGKAQGG